MIEIKTYGCKVNTYDTGLLEVRLGKSDYLKNLSENVVVFNTCAVTGEATKETVREIRRLKRAEPNSRIVVTGCGAQVDTRIYEELKETDLVVANSHKGKLEEIIADFLKGHSQNKTHKSNIFKKEDLEPGGGIEPQHTRSFLKIQDGCNSYCSYCVIPMARGKSRSLSVDYIVNRVNELHGQGIHEVVLTGIHIGDYEEGGKVLEDLVGSVLNKTSMPRIRLTSLEPVEVTPRLLDLYSNDRLCPHFHMSIQSANSKVLKDMRRKYDANQVEESLIKISQQVPGAFVGMDVIVGFPSETEEEFDDTYERLARLPWTKIHVFPYSDRPDTRAEKIEDKVPQNIINHRASRLRELSLERYHKEALKQVGLVKKSLPLNYQKVPQALSRDFWKIQLAEKPASMNEAEIKIVGYDFSENKEGVLVGEEATADWLWP